MGGLVNGIDNSKSVHSNLNNASKRDTGAVIEKLSMQQQQAISMKNIQQAILSMKAVNNNAVDKNEPV